MKKLNLKAGLAAAILLIVAYILGSRALDTGSYWEYLGCLVALAVAIKYIVHAVRNLNYGHKD